MRTTRHYLSDRRVGQSQRSPTKVLRVIGGTALRLSHPTILMLAVLLAPAAALAQGNAKEIMAKRPAELIEILNNANATTFEKAKACQRLAVVGTKDAVPALAALLPDEKLNVYARTALENIPGPEPAAALREAAKTLKGRPLVGVIDSIGQRWGRQQPVTDPRLEVEAAKDADILVKLLTDKDTSIASAAAGAIGRVGAREATEGLWEAIRFGSPIKTAAADGLLNWVELLAKVSAMEAEKEHNWKIMEEPADYFAGIGGVIDFKEYLNNLPKPTKVAGLYGMFRSMGKCEGALYVDAEVRCLLTQLRSPDRDFFNVGLAVARELRGEKVTAALAAELDKLPPERRALLLLALADREDKPELEVIIKESKSDSEEVRKAAVYALTQRADADAAKALIDIALGEGPVAAAAQKGLVNIRGKGIDSTITDKYASADEQAKVTLLGLIGDRQITAAIPLTKTAIDDANQSVRLAALAAMAKLIDVADLDVLVGRALAADKSKEETAAARSALDVAVLRMGDRDATAAKLAEHIENASPANRSYIYDLLRNVSGKKALEAVVAGAKSADAAQKDAATRVLGEWVNTDAAPALLEIAKNDPDRKYRIRALRGYIRIARQLEIPWWEASDAPAVKLKMYDAAMVVAGRNEEKQLALDILTRIPSPETLSRAVACLADPALKEAAAATVVQIAGHVIGGQPKAVAAAMHKVLDAKITGKTGDQARQLLERAGG